MAFVADVLKSLLDDEPLASVILITPSVHVSSIYYSGLKRCDVPSLRLIQNMNYSFSPGVEITEIDRVKGLEFDYVILVEASAAISDTPANRRLLR